MASILLCQPRSENLSEAKATRMCPGGELGYSFLLTRSLCREIEGTPLLLPELRYIVLTSEVTPL
jgi:hypothetical protein